MPAPKTATRITSKQRACTHPPQHVHPTYDERWETCDLCHIIRPRPLPAPWIVEWDESQPTEEPPALFAEPAPVASVPTRTRHHPAAIVREQPETFGDLPRAARRDRDLLGDPTPWMQRLSTRDLSDMPPDQLTTCHRCHGAGIVPQDPLPITRSPCNPDPLPSTLPPRECPRCLGNGRIAKYTA